MKVFFNIVLSSEDDFIVCKFDIFFDLIFIFNKDRLKWCCLYWYFKCVYFIVYFMILGI